MSAGLRGAYVDSKGVRWDTNDADFEGYLFKQSRWVREWRKRYLILKGSKMFFSKTSETAPHGMIDLVDCFGVKPADSKTRRQFSLEIISSDDNIFMFAESEREKDEWINAISSAVKKHSSMLLSDKEEDEDGSEEER